MRIHQIDNGSEAVILKLAKDETKDPMEGRWIGGMNNESCEAVSSTVECYSRAPKSCRSWRDAVIVQRSGAVSILFGRTSYRTHCAVAERRLKLHLYCEDHIP